MLSADVVHNAPSLPHALVSHPSFSLGTPQPLCTPAPEPVTRPSFDQLLAASDLPPPGPEHYAARRKLWVAQPTDRPARSPSPSSSRRRLEKALASPQAIYSGEIWKNDIGKAWKGLSEGAVLKHRLPMGLIIVHAAWIRDNTWPVGMEAPDSDDELMESSAP